MKYYRSIVSVVLTVLVLFSSSSFIVGIHLCCGHVQDVALFSPAEDCGMGKAMPPCHQPSSKTCCENEAIVHSGDDFKASVKGVMLPLVPVMDMELPHVLKTLHVLHLPTEEKMVTLFPCRQKYMMKV